MIIPNKQRELTQDEKNKALVDGLSLVAYNAVKERSLRKLVDFLNRFKKVKEKKLLSSVEIENIEAAITDIHQTLIKEITPLVKDPFPHVVGSLIHYSRSKQDVGDESLPEHLIDMTPEYYISEAKHHIQTACYIYVLRQVSVEKATYTHK